MLIPHRSVRFLRALGNEFHFYSSLPDKVFVEDAIAAYRGANLCSQVEGKSLLLVKGRDSCKFLQGLVTTQMEELRSAGSGTASLFLSPQGRILFSVFLWPLASRTDGERVFCVEHDSLQTSALQRHLQIRKLNSDVHLELVESDDLCVFQCWGPATQAGGSILKDIKKSPAYMEDKRAPGLGYRILAKNSPQLVPMASFTDYRLFKGMLGVPEYASELLPENKSLPQESNFDLMNAIDYKKGCYMGQELTIRTHHRGVVRKRILPVQIESTTGEHSVSNDLQLDLKSDVAHPAPNASLYSALGDATLGKYISQIAFNLGFALVRLDRVHEPLSTLKEGVSDVYLSSKTPTHWGSQLPN